MVCFFLVALLTSLVASCSFPKNENRGPSQSQPQALPPAVEPDPDYTDGSVTGAPSQPNTHLLFTAVDPLASPWQASVYRMDLGSNAVERLLTGESADTAVFKSGGEALLFNRYFDSQNFRRLKLSDAKVMISSQQKFPGGEIGDPHDALYLGGNRVLLAHYTQGKLTVMEQSSGKDLGNVDVEWDLPSDTALRPEALLLATVDGKQFVYVVHQGLMFRDGLMLPNGTQQVFVLNWADGKLLPVDLDSSQPKVQGIKLKGSFPVPVRFAHRNKFLFVSMCSRYLVTSGNTLSEQCVNAIEEIDPRTNQVSTIPWDLAASDVWMNGSVNPGPDQSMFYANVERRIGPNQFEKAIMRFNTSDQTMSSVYTFKPDSGGFWGSFYDEHAKTLYIGDVGYGSVGKFVVIKESGEQRNVSLDLVPYAGAFLTATRD